MNTQTIRFTRTQLDEMLYKVEVMQTDYDPQNPGGMARRYGLDGDALKLLSQKVSAKPRAPFADVELTEREAVAMYGELGNAADIAEDNIPESYGDDRTYANTSRRMRDGQQRIKAVFPDVSALLQRTGLDS